MKKGQEENGHNVNILCKQKEMKQVQESEIHIIIINQGLLKNKVNKREDNQDSGTKFFFHGHCYCCSNFGHKATNCAFKFRNMQSKKS